MTPHVEYSKQFTKHYAKRILGNKKLEKQFDERVALFFEGVRERPISDHALTGKLAGKRSFSITGDVRLVYKEADDSFVFVDIGSHNQVYCK